MRQKEKKEQMSVQPSEPLLRGIKNRCLQALARSGPGAQTLRVHLHRWRGVKIGTNVNISSDIILETAHPDWISIGSGVQIGIRTTILAHIHSLPPKKRTREDTEYVSVRIEDDVNIGPGVMILPNVTIGYGAVVSAGSVVTSSVPPLTMVQGNPARPIAHCSIPLTKETLLKEFFRKLKPIKEKKI